MGFFCFVLLDSEKKRTKEEVPQEGVCGFGWKRSWEILSVILSNKLAQWRMHTRVSGVVTLHGIKNMIQVITGYSTIRMSA